MRARRARGLLPREQDSARSSIGSRRITLRRFFARDVPDVRIAAAEPEEGVDLRLVDLIRLHFAGDENVVAALARIADDAPKDRHASGDSRRASGIRRGLDWLDPQSRELVRPLRRLAG